MQVDDQCIGKVELDWKGTSLFFWRRRKIPEKIIFFFSRMKWWKSWMVTFWNVWKIKMETMLSKNVLSVFSRSRSSSSLMHSKDR